MNIRAISPQTNYTNKIAFKGSKEEKYIYTKDEVKDIKSNTKSNGICIGAMLAVLGGMALTVAVENDDKQKQTELFDKFEKVCTSPEIQKDTFLVKDVTGDGKADMILFKKDGTKVIFDIAKGEISNEVVTTKLEPVK